VSLHDPEKMAKLINYKETLIVILVLFQIGFTALFFIICIFISHKIAGPMFKLQKFLSRVRDGQQYDKLYFRKGDYFPEIAEDFNKTLETIRGQHENDFVYLSEVNTYLKNLSMVVPEDKKIVLSEIVTKLDEMQKRFNNR
jgi:signal transduction histidine kinase